MMDERINTKRHFYEALEPTMAEVGEVYEVVKKDSRTSGYSPYSRNTVMAVRVIDIDDDTITLGVLPKEKEETKSPFGVNRGYQEFYDHFRLDAEETETKDSIPIDNKVVDPEATEAVRKKVEDENFIRKIEIEKASESIKEFNKGLLDKKLSFVNEVSAKYNYPEDELDVVKKAVEYMYGTAMNDKLPKNGMSIEELSSYVKGLTDTTAPNALSAYTRTWNEELFRVRRGTSKAGKPYVIFTVKGKWYPQAEKGVGPFTSKLLEMLAPSSKDGFSFGRSSTGSTRYFVDGTSYSTFLKPIKTPSDVGNVYKTVTEQMEITHPAYTDIIKVPSMVDGELQSGSGIRKRNTFHIEGWDYSNCILSAARNEEKSEWEYDRHSGKWNPPTVSIKTGFVDSTD